MRPENEGARSVAVPGKMSRFPLPDMGGWMKNILASVAALVLAACSYDFTNPADSLGAGQITGRTVIASGGGSTFVAAPGVGVALQNSPFDQVTRETGRFTLLGLPAGRHTVLFRQGASLALQRDVDVFYGPDGQPEGVFLGDVRLRLTVTLQGTFTLPAPPAGGAFDGATATWRVEDEVTGAVAALASGPAAGQVAWTFFGLPVGPHRIRFAVSGTLLDPILGSVPVTYIGGPLSITVAETSEGQVLTMNPVPLQRAAATPGKLRFRIAAVGAGAVDPSSASVFLSPPPPPTANLTPDSTGLVEVDLPEGLYTLDISPPFVDHPPGTQPTFLQPPPQRTVVVGAAQTTDLGTVYAVSDSVAIAESVFCVQDADCAPGICSGGACVGWTPPPVASPRVPFCGSAVEAVARCSASCVRCPSGFGTCLPNGADWVCLPDGAPSCTPDGLTVVSSGC